MKVLYLIDTLETGGAETSILEISSGLKKWKPLVVYIYPGSTLRRRFEKNGIKVYSLDVHKKFGILESVQKLSKIIEIEKPDIIHATLFKAELISRIVGPKFSIPVINSFVNDTYSKERYQSLTPKQSLSLKIYQLVDRYTSNRVTKFMSITKAIVPTYSEIFKIDPSLVEIIYRGRDIQGLRNKIDKEKLSELQTGFGSGPIFLTVSRLLIRKGYIEAITAMKDIIEEYPQVKYLIAGEGHDRKNFENLIKSFNLQKNIILLGNRNDVPTLMALADVFLFPSHYEGQGGALVEAMILGKPIISSKIPVIEESVKDQFSALLFEPKNVKDLIKKMHWAINNPQKMESFGANAQKEAEMRFDIINVVYQHEILYDKVYNQYKSKYN